ncbi:MAG TPA: hypothetical protein VG078_07260, partial [Acidimicrobiales bacterium]|nr:hypothetical protein [Acidimicrobiales bacterium]
LLGYSTQDYLLRSMSSMLAPSGDRPSRHAGRPPAARRGDGVGTTGGWLEEGGAVEGEARRPLRRVVLGIATVGLASLAVGGAGTLVRDSSDFVYVASPVSVTVGIVLVLYAANLYRKFPMRGDAASAANELQGVRLLASGSVVMLLMVSLFRNVSHYAAVKGRNLAATVERLLPGQPSVVVYSAKRLYLQPPVVETRLDPENAAYNFAHNGPEAAVPVRPQVLPPAQRSQLRSERRPTRWPGHPPGVLPGLSAESASWPRSGCRSGHLVHLGRGGVSGRLRRTGTRRDRP